MTLLRHPRVHEPRVSEAARDFLADLAHADRSAHTRANYRSDRPILRRSLSGVTTVVLRGQFATLSDLARTTRACSRGRSQASWAGRTGRSWSTPTRALRSSA